MSVFTLKRLSAAAALSVLAVPAFAGGFAEPAPVPVVPAPVVPVVPVAPSGDWTGGYVGAQVGMGTLDFSLDAEDEEGSLSLTSDEFDGVVYGVHAGYMQDFGQFVLGGELAYVMTEIGEEFAGDTAGESSDFSLDSVLRLGVRAGFDAGRVLPYATAGWARANMTFSDTDAAGTVEQEESFDGYYYGAGVDYALTDRFSIGAEVLRHDFTLDEGEFDGVDVELGSNLTTISLRGSFRF